MQVRAVARAAEILLCLSAQAQGLTLTDITRSVGLSKATIYRILQTLIEVDFVRYEPTAKRYFLGREVLGLSRLVEPYDVLRQIARPYMQRVRDESRETVTLAVRQGTERITLDLVLGSHELKMAPELGSAKPIYAGAAGKALLAYIPSDELSDILSHTEFKAITANTIVSERQLRRELERVRRRGFAISVEESMSAVAASAAPIFNRGAVVAALNVFGPKERLPHRTLQKLGGVVATAAREISRMLSE